MSEANPHDNRLKIAQLDGKLGKIETKFEGAMTAMEKTGDLTTKSTERIEKKIDDFIKSNDLLIDKLFSKHSKLHERVSINETSINMAKYLSRTVMSGVIGIIIWLVKQHMNH